MASLAFSEEKNGHSPSQLDILGMIRLICEGMHVLVHRSYEHNNDNAQNCGARNRCNIKTCTSRTKLPRRGNH